jgi:hypothetical protein
VLTGWALYDVHSVPRDWKCGSTCGFREPGSSARIEMGLGWTAGAAFPKREYVFLFCSVQTGSGAQPATYAMSAVGPVPLGEEAAA